MHVGITHTRQYIKTMARGRPHKISRREQVELACQGDGNELINEGPEVPPAKAQEDELAELREAMRLQA